VELHEPFGLTTVFGAETSTAQDQNHRMWSLQFGELPALSGVVGKFVIGENSSGNDVGSHWKSSSVDLVAVGDMIPLANKHRSTRGEPGRFQGAIGWDIPRHSVTRKSISGST
jgi:hypothetical protein